MEKLKLLKGEVEKILQENHTPLAKASLFSFEV